MKKLTDIQLTTHINASSISVYLPIRLIISIHINSLSCKNRDSIFKTPAKRVLFFKVLDHDEHASRNRGGTVSASLFSSFGLFQAESTDGQWDDTILSIRVFMSIKYFIT